MARSSYGIRYLYGPRYTNDKETNLRFDWIVQDDPYRFDIDMNSEIFWKTWKRAMAAVMREEQVLGAVRSKNKIQDGVRVQRISLVTRRLNRLPFHDLMDHE